MSHARSGASMTLATIIALSGCAKDVTAPTNSINDPFGSGCNGNGFQLRTVAPTGRIGSRTGEVSLSVMPPTGTPQQLQQVIVYGTPVQRPYRGYGDITSYGGVTTTFTYDRNLLDECSFGDGRTGVPVGEVADDTLDVPIEAPDGISQEDWDRVTPRVKRQLREAAWYLAEFWVPNDIPGIGLLTREARRGLIYAALAKGFNQSQEQAPDRRRATVDFEAQNRRSTRGLSQTETLRLDAFLLGCSTASQFRNLNSWNADQAESWASRVVSGWAADQTEPGNLRYLEPRLSLLGALGAAAGREGSSCSQAAVNHFQQVTNDLYDPSQGSGDNGTQF